MSSGVNAHSRPPARREIRAGFLPVVGVTDHSTEPPEGICEEATDMTVCSPTCESPFMFIDGEAANDEPANDSKNTARHAGKNFIRMKINPPSFMKKNV